VPLVQDDEADVIQDRRIGSKSEIQLLRCGDDNLAGAKRVLVDVADPHAAVERRDADAERREGPCEDLLRLSGQGSERGDIDRTSLLCEAHQTPASAAQASVPERPARHRPTVEPVRPEGILSTSPLRSRVLRPMSISAGGWVSDEPHSAGRSQIPRALARP
jgi:hypothetical protein